MAVVEGGDGGGQVVAETCVYEQHTRINIPYVTYYVLYYYIKLADQY